MSARRDVDLMEHADGERDVALDADGREKIAAVRELGELVRGRLERAADDVPEARFAAMWSQIDGAIDGAIDKPPSHAGFWRRFARWFDHHRGHVLTGAVSAGAVAALALVLRGPSQPSGVASPSPIPVTPVSDRSPSEIEELETPGGNGSVFHLVDDDGATTVIWVTPSDTDTVQTL